MSLLDDLRLLGPLPSVADRPPPSPWSPREPLADELPPTCLMLRDSRCEGGMPSTTPLWETQWWPTMKELGGLQEPGSLRRALFGFRTAENVGCVNNHLCVTS